MTTPKTRRRKAKRSQVAAERAVVAATPAGEQPTFVPRPAIVGPLATLADIQREWGRVYRAARRGELPPTVASRLIYMLSEGGRITRAMQEIAELRSLREAVEAARGTPFNALADESEASPVPPEVGFNDGAHTFITPREDDLCE